MHRSLSHLILLFTIVCSSVSAIANGVTSPTSAGFQIERFVDPKRARPVLIDWWYPVKGQSANPYNYGLGRGAVVEAGAIAEGTYPLVVLSHGALGAARNYSWLAEPLARAGYMVAGISHFEESYAHGADTIDPSSVLRAWERPLDVKATLTHIESNSPFSAFVDHDRIAFVGHSSGGATAIFLTGVSFDPGAMGEYCQSPASQADKGCDYANNAIDPPSPAQVFPVATDFSDPRIKAFVALDPALGPGFVDYANVATNLQILIVGSTDNDFLPFANHAQRIAAGYASARTLWLSHGEGHFVYLNACDAPIEANGVPLCRDREGVDRQEIHHKLFNKISTFLDHAL